MAATPYRPRGVFGRKRTIMHANNINPHRSWLTGLAHPRHSAVCWVALAVAVLALLSSCGRPTPKGQQPRRVNAVCTIGMISDIVSRVGGDRVSATGIMGEGVDPHLYKASPGDVRLLTDADIIFYNGLNLEGKMGDVLVKMARERPVVAVTEKIDESRLRSPPEFAGHHDPHVWFDVEMWSLAVERICDALIELDPAGKDTYTRNTADYLEELLALNEEVARDIATIPRDKRILVTAHDAFGYFGRAYDIEVRAIQGISTESEASLKDINDLVDLLVERKVAAVFIESSVPRKAIDALLEGCQSRGHTVKVGGQLFSDAMGAAGTPEGTYIGMVRHNVRTIVAALTGQVPAEGS